MRPDSPISRPISRLIPVRVAAALLVALASVAALASSCSPPEAAPSAPVDTDAALVEEAAVEAAAADGFIDADTADVAAYRDDGGIWHLPDPGKTPGALCTASDPNFAGLRYKEQIAICNRNIPKSERDAVGADYGIAAVDFPSYEFDHYIPLSIGGSDDPKNLWPQPHTEALRKDVVEQQVFDGMNNGTLTQAQAIALIRAWRP